MSSRKILFLSILFLISLFILSSGCTDEIPGTGESRFPSIGNNSATGEYILVSHTFLFENKEIKIVIPVDKGIYAAAYNSDKSAYINQEKLASDNWSSEYYKSFVDPLIFNPMYNSILSQFRELKDEMSLDSDRYAELILAYVQSVPYKTDDLRIAPKFPVETVYENSGDCDDKSLLAAALLSAEDYEVALLEFEEEEHMALGIRSSDCFYKGTGYAYVEVTDYNYPGWPLTDINEVITITSNPVVIPVGDGKVSYKSCDEVLFIYETMLISENNADSLKSKITIQTKELENLLDVVNDMSEHMNNLKAQGHFLEYNRLISDYNSKISEYNERSSSLDLLIEKYNNNVNKYNYVIEHRYNRKGVYEYLLTGF